MLSFSPDWSYAYFIDAGRIPEAAQLMLVLVDAASLPAGFATASGSAGARRAPGVARLVLIPGALAVAGTAAMLGRLSVYATYAQFHGDFGTESVAGSPLGYALLWVGAIVVGGAVWTFHVLRKMASDR